MRNTIYQTFASGEINSLTASPWGLAAGLFFVLPKTRTRRHLLIFLKGTLTAALGLALILKANQEDKTMDPIWKVFKETCVKHGEQTAIIDGHHRLTWREVKTYADRAGRFLSAHGVKPGVPVVLRMKKNWQAVCMMYGTVAAGGYYVFVDPDQPEKRLRSILNTLQTGILIQDSVDFESLPGYTAEAALNSRRYFCKRSEADASDPLYAVFTSGSTGEPKGVLVSRGAVAQFMQHFIEMSGLAARDVIGNQAPFDFDVSVKDLYGACFTGASVVLIPKVDFAMPKALMDCLTDNRVTVLIWAVSALCIVSTFKGFDYRTPKALRLVMFSGEVMPMKHLKIWQDHLPGAAFINLYGPSEITCNALYYRVKGGEDRLPIGVPFDGRQVLLLDLAGNIITEDDVTGEICICGESIGMGYIGRPDLTNKVFRTIYGMRSYCTGDLGYRENGQFFFVGRADDQIKLMGHRIELGEIEKAMGQIQAVERACVTYDPEKKRMTGWYTGEIESRQLRRALKDSLPAYMIPTKLRRLETFPVNSHGKIDRRKLKEAV